MPRIDALAKSDGSQFYIEILAKHGHRLVRDKADSSAE
jgi:hypothetical protein